MPGVRINKKFKAPGVLTCFSGLTATKYYPAFFGDFSTVYPNFIPGFSPEVSGRLL
jgi:hypothetical protein